MRSRSRKPLKLAVVALGALLVPSLRAAPTYLNAREVVLHFRAAEEVRSAELWVSTDSGRTWKQVEAVRRRHSLRWTAAADGRHDFYLVLANDAGRSADPPGPGTRPTATIIVDTTPPLVQIHAAQREAAAPGGRPTLAVKASLIEENLSDTGLRLYFRGATGNWEDGGPLRRAEAGFAWMLPDGVPDPLDIRVVATDLAGNIAADELSGISFVQPEPLLETPAEATTPPRKVERDGPELVAHVQPVEVHPAATTADAERVRGEKRQTTTKATALSGDPNAALPAAGLDDAPPTTENTDSARRLREAARRLMEDGRYALATARLEDALRLTPRDTDVLTDLGAALYRGGRYEEAETRYAAATRLLPDHAAAIEGLALVAATRKQYGEAREHLRHLTELTPSAGSAWLRLGDIEHRLGNLPQARAAWEHVLEAPDAPPDLRKNAQRRLEYFRAADGRGTDASKP